MDKSSEDTGLITGKNEAIRFIRLLSLLMIICCHIMQSLISNLLGFEKINISYPPTQRTSI